MDNKNNSTKQFVSIITLCIGVVLFLGGVLVGVFNLTQEDIPHASELSFIEYSSNPDLVGSVVPASCESSPPTSHFTGDCPTPAPRPSGSISARGCTIAVGASRCNTRVQWRISNPRGNGNLRNVTHRFTYSNADSGNSNQSLWYGTQTLAARDGNTNLATARVTASCARGSNWYSGVCYPAPTVALNPSPGHIQPGRSSTLSWTVSGATSCTASLGWSGSKSVTTGSESVSPAVSTDYRLSCSGPGGTTAVTTRVRVPSGSLFVYDCPGPIAFEASSCPARVVWSGQDFLGTPSLMQGALERSRSISNTGVNYPVTPDDRTFTFRDTGSTFSVTASAVASCATGSIWISAANRCVTIPTVDIVPTPDLIRSGNEANLRITIDSAYDLTCVVTGGINTTIDHNGTSGRSNVYNLQTNPLTAAQIVSISCTMDLYPVITATDEARVNVIPLIQEI